MNRKQWLFLTILSSLFVRLHFLLADKRLLWDSAVYVGMGKYLLSLGSVGVWEPLRPLVWPSAIGLVWKAGLDPLLGAKFLSLAVSLAIIVLTYDVGERTWKGSGLWSAAIVAFTPFFIFYEHWGLSEIPATLLGLVAISLALRGYWLLAGLASSLSFLTKFPSGIIFAALLCAILYQKKLFSRACARLITGFAIPTTTYLLLNTLLYANPLLPFIQGTKVIESAAIWLYDHGWTYYLLSLPGDNLFFLLAPLGLILLTTRKDWKPFTVCAAAVLIMSYFTYLTHKEIRFAILMLPYLAILAGTGLAWLSSRLTRAQFGVLLMILAFIFILHAKDALTSYDRFEGTSDTELIKRYYQALDPASLKGTVYASDPLLGAYSDVRFEPLYYPLFTAERVRELQSALAEGKVGHLLVNTCDLQCPPNAHACESSKEDFLSRVHKEFRLSVSLPREQCEYQLYELNAP